MLLIASFPAAAQQGDPCLHGALAQHDKTNPPDLVISEVCHVKAGGQFFYGNVNIIQGGHLVFDDPPDATPSDFWARSILVENGGTLWTGAEKSFNPPYGAHGGILTIHLYGPDQSNGDPSANPGMGALCKTPETATTGPCGIPMSTWRDNGQSDDLVLPGRADALGAPLKDYFYRYGPLHGDEKCSNGAKWGPEWDPPKKEDRCDERAELNTPAPVKVGYFGYKVLAVSYGGRMFLNGRVGRCDAGGYSGRWDHCVTTWGRLAKSIAVGDGVKGKEFEVETDRIDGPYISKGDQIVVTTTDYLPGHSETFDVEEVTRQPWTPQHPGRETVRVKLPAQFPHNGVRYSLLNRLEAAQGRLATMDPRQVNQGAETRAAVGILNRSVRIVSAGDNPGDPFPDSPPPPKDPNQPDLSCKLNADGKTDGKGPCYSFGGHMVVRQGFAVAYVSGVEFKQMGQGGRLAHYPIHFHMARKVPYETTIASNSINESMTRWIVLHSTLGVRVANNIGYKSIGHGFYLEDATEAGNIFDGNLGVFARAAINNDQNPRKVPGIISDNQDPKSFPPPKYVANPGFPYRSDSEYPSVFWITNGWNEFTGNMAAGAGTCGACYWLVPAANSAMADVPDRNNKMQDMKWSGYAGLQKDRNFAGSAPLKSFEGNFCTSAMMSFQTTDDAPPCQGTIAADVNGSQIFPTVRDLKGLAPPPARLTVNDVNRPDPMADTYYPHVVGAIHSTLCKQIGRPDQDLYNCDDVKVCSVGNPASCAVAVLDHYTSSFNWAVGTISSVWLRGFWYLVDNSVFTDVQNAALTFVSGGDFTHSSVIPGYWALVRNSIFVGHTQTGNGFAKDSGPFNNDSKLKCDPLLGGEPPYCLSAKEGVSLPLGSFHVNQRLFNIYDGPAYEDTNAFLDINRTENCEQGYNNGCIYNIQPVLGVPKDPATGKCYLPNAAIAWKQPNGFFYPPAFHSTNLFFNNVDIRHYVIAPLFQPNTYKTDKGASDDAYCTLNEHLFNGFSAIDRQTELNDDDGSLTGLKQTVSVNEDAFFNARAETPECWSNIGTNNDPQNACKPTVKTQAPVTAKTSPYDYVTTVIYHPETVENDQQIWSTICSTPTCYGVPLFRQSLTGNDGQGARTREWAQWHEKKCDANQNTADCRWPFIRMAGTATATRETMTVDGASYYIDTTVPREMQAKEDLNFEGGTVFFNVFQPNQTYTVFFLYLKDHTHQTYQIYVGTKFTKDDLKAVRVEIPTADFKIHPLSGPLPDWLIPDWSAVKTTGILTLKTDFDKDKSVAESLKPKPSNGLCQPHEFCKADGDKCVGNVSESDPRFRVVGEHVTYGPHESNAICSQWAVKDLDCPLSGCLGFQFTLPSTFVADATATAPSPHRPKPQSFTDPIQFTRTATAPDNNNPPKDYTPACFYPELPGSDKCPVP